MNSDTQVDKQQFNIETILDTPFSVLLFKGILCQTFHYYASIFVMQQEQYILTSFNGFKFVENFVKIFPIMFLVSYEIPEFFEQYFANKKMSTYATGESVQDINRQEFATNCIVAILMLVIPAAQPAIFSVLQVDSEYRAMFLLSTVLGTIGPFKSTVYSIFSLKQNYVYIMAGKMMTLIIHFFLFTFIYSFDTRVTNFNTWPSGFSKPMAEIIVHVVMLIVLFKGSIFSTKIHLDSNQNLQYNYKPQKNDWKQIGKNLFAFFQHLIFYLSRPVVYIFITLKVINLSNQQTKETALMDLYTYMFCQQSLSLISKGTHSATMTIMPILLHQQKYSKMRRVIAILCLIGFIINEVTCTILAINPNVILILFFNRRNNYIFQKYFDSANSNRILNKTSFLFGTEVYQTSSVVFAQISKKHFIPFLMGVMRIIGGIYFVINIDSALGQNASYEEVFFYFELLCSIMAFIFTLQAYISIFLNYKDSKTTFSKQKAEIRQDEFMIQ
ncbi:Hypothetical_protein [Hexamita inflata]|uniref:Hypothetical_protein n=1 Tax=Hexamita inflata TaxID=28002 RepID=A0AA86PEC3_9EUKA|nr:Hypothetical protein HINF_LOCUS25219 [Hexamita inflata]